MWFYNYDTQCSRAIKRVDGKTNWLPLSAIFWTENVIEWRDSETTFTDPAIMSHFPSKTADNGRQLVFPSTVFTALTHRQSVGRETSWSQNSKFGEERNGRFRKNHFRDVVAKFISNKQ
jgi:hypothetical protein